VKNKIVSRLKIAPVHYSVERKSYHPDDKTLGEYVYSENKICYSDKLGEESALLTILHEALHAMMSHSGVKQHDESMVETVAGYLFDFIRDNPKFIAMIQKMK
jgi:hypothetical protein